MTAAPDQDEQRIRDALRSVLDGPSAPDPEPRWDWRRVVRRSPWTKHAAGVALALAPFFHGQSMATAWGGATHQCREQAGMSGAYVEAGLPLVIVLVMVCVRGRWWKTCLLTITTFGFAAMCSPFDLVTFVTGVTK